MQRRLGGHGHEGDQRESALTSREGPARGGGGGPARRQRPQGHIVAGHHDVPESGEHHADGREHRGPSVRATHPATMAPHRRIRAPSGHPWIRFLPRRQLIPRHATRNTLTGKEVGGNRADLGMTAGTLPGARRAAAQPANGTRASWGRTRAMGREPSPERATGKCPPSGDDSRPPDP
ncbi:hypothetical protein SHKM778_53850 [Streptomyces sp. KM77-8]|uniref:Uncharacterized protein n=1 Tax=Streptomyces haneummycinicus TaxID=3074435 RepID=A0AAT9HNR9_9ACTN